MASISNTGTNTHAQIDTHIADVANPHSVTKTQVGLSAVTNDAQLKIASNLSDVAAQQTALDNVTNVAAATNEDVLTKDTATGNAIFKAAAGGVSAWTGLSDTPASFAGEAGKAPVVNDGETAVELLHNGIIANLTNQAGASTVAGYVYRMDPDNNDSFDYASEDEDAQAVVTPSVIANTSSGNVVLGGYADVYVTGDTVRGDWLYFSGTSGQAKPSQERRDGCIGQATANRTGAGLVKAHIFQQTTIPKEKWADEGGQTHSLMLPLSGEDDWGTEYGQVLSANATGWENAGYDGAKQWVQDPSVIVYEGRLYMAYSGGNENGIGMARSTDGLVGRTWEKYTSNPVVALGGAGTWNQRRIRSVTMIYDRFETDTAKKFKMWYMGRDVPLWIYYGYSYASHPWGTWTHYASNPVLGADSTPGPAYVPYYGLAVYRLGDLYVMWNAMNPGSSIRVHTSPDGITWTNQGDILTTTAAAWDASFTAYCSVYFNQGTFYLVYSGKNTAGANKLEQGIATSTTINGTYTKFPTNPILSPGGVGWFQNQVHAPCLLQINNQFKLWSTGQDSSLDWSIGLHEMERLVKD